MWVLGPDSQVERNELNPLMFTPISCNVGRPFFWLGYKFFVDKLFLVHLLSFFLSCLTQLSYVQAQIYSSIAYVLLVMLSCVPLEQFSQFAVFKRWIKVHVRVHLLFVFHFSCQFHIFGALFFAREEQATFLFNGANNPSLKTDYIYRYRFIYIYKLYSICFQ